MGFGTDPETDTLIIKFGNNSSIVVYLRDKSDLKSLTQYDINKILEDMSLSVTQTDDSVKVLTIQDESGQRYLKDTSLVYRVEPATDHNVKVKSRYRGRRTVFNFNVDIGMSNYLENGSFPDGNALHRVSPWGSWSFSLDPTFRTRILGPFGIEYGFGLDYNSYKFQNPLTRLLQTSNGIAFTTDTRPILPDKSKLATWHLHAKVVPMIALGNRSSHGWRLWNRINKGFRLGAGPYFGYRIWSRTKAKYKLDGAKQKDKISSNFSLNDIRYGIRGQLGIQGMDFYFSYDLSDMFQSNSGAPELNRFQFGITF